MTRRLLVTSALPYANGPIHIGHLVEYLQTDIWVRYQRSQGHEVRYFCADDTHGTAIMLRARQEKISELEVIEAASRAHQRDFDAFGVEFDQYGSTNSETNRALCHQFWASLQEQNLILEQDVTQLFDVQEGVFLADRFVKGTCPKCGEKEQNGDNCEKCGATYSATDLIDPRSVHNGSTPELRTAKHLFVELEKEHEFLNDWTQAPGHLQPEVANYLKGFFLNNPLRNWDISRPAPYFGFEIPSHPGNYWYVWFDAPIGYLASTDEWCKKNNDKLENWWNNEQTEIFHFIGKDIVYFHTLFWPAMLKAAGYQLPRHIQVHGFLGVKGEKMSKSKGALIAAQTYAEHLDPAYLRYYYASKLNTGMDDIDLDFEDLAQKVNSDIVGKVVNLASRTARFLKSSGLSATYPEDEGLFAKGAGEGAEIGAAYEGFDYAKAMRLIMGLADRANEYVDRMQPWTLKKQPGQEARLQDVCTVCINLYRQLIVYLAPVLPKLAADSAELLGANVDSWSDSQTPLVGVRIGTFKPLLQRVDPAQIAALVAASQPTSAAEPPRAGAAEETDELSADPLAPECTIDDFAKVDLRVAKVLQAEAVPKAKKLLKLTLSLGGDSQRTVFAGVKAAYAPEQLVGRLVVMVANLKPRQMKFGLSEGMVVAAGQGGTEVFLLAPDSGATPGQRVG